MVVSMIGRLQVRVLPGILPLKLPLLTDRKEVRKMDCKNCHKWADTLLSKLCPKCFAQKYPDEDFNAEVERTLYESYLGLLAADSDS